MTPRLSRCLALAALLAAPTFLSAAEEGSPTIIESSGPAEMVSTATESTFTFHDHVVVTGTNLKLTCDQLVVVAKRVGDPSATFAKQENFKSLLATGHVIILQSQREATCGRAEVFPADDKVILTENPRVRSLDGSYEATGPRMLLLRGEQRAIIEGTQSEPTHFRLPTIRDLGPGKDKKASPADDASPKVATPK
jgi:lipopolysaccharide export system protein LptA